jgi:hypothetical protein
MKYLRFALLCGLMILKSLWCSTELRSMGDVVVSVNPQRCHEAHRVKSAISVCRTVIYMLLILFNVSLNACYSLL